MQPLQHADGMLTAYLPREELVIEADLFDTSATSSSGLPGPAAPTAANRSFFNEVQALKLGVSQVVPIHGKPVSWAEFLKVAGAPRP